MLFSTTANVCVLTAMCALLMERISNGVARHAPSRAADLRNRQKYGGVRPRGRTCASSGPRRHALAVHADHLRPLLFRCAPSAAAETHGPAIPPRAPRDSPPCPPQLAGVWEAASLARGSPGRAPNARSPRTTASSRHAFDERRSISLFLSLHTGRGAMLPGSFSAQMLDVACVGTNWQ